MGDHILSGIRVLEFSGHLASSLAGMLLADLGAEVIVIEGPDEAAATTPAYHLYHRGKRIVACNSSVADDLGLVRRLADNADVILDGLNGSRPAAFGIELAGLSQVRPELITCSMPPFDPALGLGELPASDPLIAEFAGLGGDHGREVQGLPVASCYAGLLAANCIVAACFTQRRTGQGQHIEVPIHSALLLTVGFRLVRVSGREPTRAMASPLITTYRCADDRWIQIHVATPRFLPGFMEAIGADEDWDERTFERLVWGRDPELAAKVGAHLAAIFAGRSSDEWESILSAAGLCCVKCRTNDEWLSHPHALESGLAVKFSTALGPATQPGRLVTADGLPPLQPLQRELQPRFHRTGLPRRVLAPPPTRALEGIRVLDLCLILAGPTGARMLGEFGASVVKIDSRTGPVFEPFWQDTNRGKRSMVIDLKTEGGQEIIWKLIENADVVVENFRLGVAERLGIGYEQVAARFPRIIYASLNAYGSSGPMAGWPGWEQLAQATTGMLLRQTGPHGRPPELIENATNDYAGGLAMSLGVLAALAEREVSGRGRHVHATLAAPAMLLQALATDDRPSHRYEVPGMHSREGPGIEDLVDWPELRAAGLLTTSPSQQGDVQHLGVTYHMSLTPGQAGTPAPPLGGDTIELLRELGYSDLQIARWFGEGVVASYAR